MFTAIVLVCLSGQDVIAKNCFTYTNEILWANEAQCKKAVMLGLQNNIFKFDEPDVGKSWAPASFYCVPWTVKSST